MSDYLEQFTFEYLMESALSRIPDTIDKREGSVIYTAVAPSMLELSLAFMEVLRAKNNISPDTATGEALTDLAEQNGVFRKDAVKAQRKGSFNIAIPLGTKFSIEGVFYTVKALISGLDYNLECDTVGEIGNSYTGTLLPASYVEGLTSATITDIIIAGAEIETDEQLRERYKQNIVNPPQEGNVAQYLKWASDYEGIGIAKVFPLWNGGNTVKVAITNRLYLPAEQTLVDAFQLYMDPNAAGLGSGQAPIGSKVTIVGGTQKNIDVYANIILTEGYVEAEGAAAALSAYFESITYVKPNASYMRIGSALLDCQSIADISNLTINGGIVDIPLVGDEIPVLNSLNLVVI